MKVVAGYRKAGRSCTVVENGEEERSRKRRWMMLYTEQSQSLGMTSASASASDRFCFWVALFTLGLTRRHLRTATGGKIWGGLNLSVRNNSQHSLRPHPLLPVRTNNSPADLITPPKGRIRGKRSNRQGLTSASIQKEVHHV